MVAQYECTQYYLTIYVLMIKVVNFICAFYHSKNLARGGGGGDGN